MTSPPWLHPVLLGLVLALAGCSFPFAGQQTPASSPSATPHPVVPPGVEDGTLTNHTALLAAHTSSLRETGFRIEESNAGTRLTYAATANYRSFRVIPGPDASAPAIWANDTHHVARLTERNETVYRRPPRFWIGPSRMTGAARLRFLFNASTYSRSGPASCDDRRCVILTATGSPRFEEFTAEAVVDAAGVVRRFNATYTRASQNHSTTQTYRLTVVRQGTDTIDRPAWVNTAINETWAD